MLTTAEYEDLVSEILKKYGYLDHDIKVVIHKNLTSSIAYIHTGLKVITLSHDWFNCNGADFAVYMLKHEIAHLKYHNHGAAFKAECLRMGIRAKARIGPKDFANHDWHWLVRARRGRITASTFDSLWVPAQYCRYKDCEKLV